MENKTGKTELTPEQADQVNGGCQQYNFTPPCPKCGKTFTNMLDYYGHVAMCTGAQDDPKPDEPQLSPRDPNLPVR